MSYFEKAREITADLMARHERWLTEQAEARGVTVQQLAETHELRIFPPHWTRDERTGSIGVAQELRLVPKTVP